MPLKNIEVIPNGEDMETDSRWNQHHIISYQNPSLPGRCPSQSTISTNQDICRICHCEGDAGPDNSLVAPCYCSGSLRWVHQQCLQQWIKSSDIKCCELCKFQFIMQTKLKTFSQWESLQMTRLEKRKLLVSVLFHAIGLTCVAWSLYVLIGRTAEELRSGVLEWPFWTKLMVVAIGFSGAVVFMYIQCKAYANLLRRWKAYNRVIFIQNAPEKPALPPDSPKTEIHIALPTFKLNPGNCGSVLPPQAVERPIAKAADNKDNQLNQGCETTNRDVTSGKQQVTGCETISSDEGETHGLLNI